jgi:hypothetical protein
MAKNGRLMIEAPPESIDVACESSWMNAETFLQWLHFQRHAHSPGARPVFLILDEHSCHKDMRSLNMLEIITSKC